MDRKRGRIMPTEIKKNVAIFVPPMAICSVKSSPGPNFLEYLFPADGSICSFTSLVEAGFGTQEIEVVVRTKRRGMETIWPLKLKEGHNFINERLFVERGDQVSFSVEPGCVDKIYLSFLYCINLDRKNLRQYVIPAEELVSEQNKPAQ